MPLPIGFSRSSLRVFVLFALAFGFLVPGVAAPQTLSDGHPSMANVTDVTGGATYLLQIQDASRLVSNTSNGVTTTSIQLANTANSQVTFTTTDTVVQSTSSGAFSTTIGRQSSQATGRITNSNNDVVVVLSAVDNIGQGGVTHTQWDLSVLDPPTGKVETVALPASFYPAGTVNVQLAMGDFNGDHLTDILMYYSSQSGSSTRWAMMTATADTSSSDPLALKFGPEFSGPSGFPSYVVGSLVTADFNADQRDEAAMLESNNKVIDFFVVNPKTMAITAPPTPVPVTLPAPMVDGQVTLAAGKFRDANNADVVVFGQIYKQPDGYSVIPIRITPSPAADGTFKTTPVTQGIFRFPGYHDASGALAQAAPLLYSPQLTQELLLLGIQTRGGASYIEIGGFSNPPNNEDPLSTFGWYSETERTYGGGSTLMSLHWGNFDNQLTDSFGKQQHNPMLQVQSEELDYGNVAHSLIFDVNPPNGFVPSPSATKTNWLKQQSDFTLGSVPSGGSSEDASSDLYLASDIQGRSLRLGSPIIMRIQSQIQPEVVLGLPPMHADYIATFLPPGTLPGCDNPSVPCIANISVKPSTEPSNTAKGFQTNFKYASQDNVAGNSSSTTSWGIATSLSVGESITANDGVNNASAEFKDTVSASYNATVAKEWGTYSQSNAATNLTTGFEDRVVYTSQGENLYYYPVLGCGNSAICPKDGSGTPTYVLYSVPDNTSPSVLDADQLDWYQPIQEPGQIFSYPWNDDTLQYQYAPPSPSTPPTSQVSQLNISSCIGLSGGETGSQVAWKMGSNTSTTTGWTSAWGTDASLSISAGVGVVGVDNANVSTSFDFSQNASVKSLNKSATALDSSLGVGLTVPGFEGIASCCNYGFAQEIYRLSETGHSPQAPCSGAPTGDCVPLKDPQANQPVGFAVNGPLFTGYLAAVTNGGQLECSNLGGFWQQAYSLPDIALNHPVRWTYDKTAPPPSITFNAPDSALTPVRQNFYQMKGFFITKTSSANNPDQLNVPTGPVLQHATATDVLNLTTRVYNYSVVDTTGTVYVRTYAQKYCSTSSSSDPSCMNGTTQCGIADLCGAAFQIGTDQTISSINGFQSSTSPNPNWRLSTVVFDPQAYSQTKAGGVDLVFWVVVWMQDANGNLAREMPYHGLKSIPSASITGVDQEPFETYSNNVGMYGGFHSVFSLLPVGTTLGATPSTGTLNSIALTAPPQTVLNTKVGVTSSMTTSGGSFSNVQLAYYDGDPANGGSLFDLQNLSYVQPGYTYAHVASYTPSSCGVHSLFVVATTPSSSTVRASTKVDVTLDSKTVVQTLIAATNSATFTDASAKTALLALLNQAAAAYNANNPQAAEVLLSSFLQQVSTSGITTAGSSLAALSNTLLSCGSDNFYLTALNTSATVSGGSASYNLAITPTGGFTGTAALACTTSSGASCALSINSVPLSGGAQQSFTLTVNTISTEVAGFATGVSGWSRVAALFLVLVTTSTLSRKRIQLRLAIIAIVAVVVASTVIGCGGSVATTSNPKSVSLTVTATSGGITQSIPLTVELQ